MTRDGRESARGPLRYAGYRWLLGARTTTLLGSAAAPIALAFAVLDLTGSAADLGLVLASRSVALVAVLLFGGVIADRLPRQRVLVGSSLLAAATQAAVAALVLTDTATVCVLAALSAANGAVAAVAFPAAAALTPQTVPAGFLQPANALLRLSTNSATIAGATLGGVLVAAVGPGYGLLADALTYAIAAALFRQVSTLASPAEPVASPVGTVLTSLRDGWSEFTARRWTPIVVAQFAVVNAAFVAALAVLGPLVADTTIGRGGYGLVLAAQAAGLVAGGLVALRWRPHRPLFAGVALTVVSALPALAWAQAPRLPVLLMAAFLAGAAIEQFGIAWDVSLQQHIPADRLARVYSYDAVGSFLAIPVGEATVGPLATVVGVQPTLLGCAGAILAATGLALSSRSVRALRRIDSPSDS